MAAKKIDRPKKKKGQKAQPEQTVEKKTFSVSNIKEFAGEVKSEFGKIAWPDKKATMGSTGVVIVLVMIISLYLGAVDLFIGKLVGYILN